MAFEAILTPQDRKPKRWLRVMIAASLGVHAAALAAGVVHSLWQVEEMALPAVQVTLTAAVPPPPPPPPPPARRASSTKSTPRNPDPKPETLVQPKEMPKEPPAAEEAPASDDSQAEGEAGGEVGGVAGGVVGGVVGSPAPPPPPPRVAASPKLVSPQVGSRQLLINPQSPAYRPKIPRALATSGQSFVAIVRMCVSAQGAVTGVSVMKGAGAAIDSQLPSVLGRWRYKPLLIDGQPTPFCYLLRYEIAER